MDLTSPFWAAVFEGESVRPDGARLSGATVAGIGSVAVDGAAAVALDGASVSGVGSTTGGASLSVTLADDTVAGTGTVATDAALNTTLAGATAAGAGSVANDAALAVTTDDATVAGTGTTDASSVAFTLPPSDEYPLDLYHLRRGMVGGRLARCWTRFTIGATTHVVDIAHGGSAADSREHVTANVGATRHLVTLPAGNRTGPQNATSIADQLVADGLTATTDGDEVSISGATSLVIPATVDTTDRNLRGMWGGQRDYWGEGGAGITLNQNGGTGGIGTTNLGTLSDDSRIPAARTGRILAIYIFGQGGFTPRLAVGTGQTYSTDPGAMTIVGQGQVATGLTTASPFGAVAITPATITSDTDIAAIYRGDGATSPGGPRYRSHAASPVGRGDIPANQQLVWDTTTDAAATTAFGATYDPISNSTFTLNIMIGVVFELQDAAGNYYADGTLDDWHGHQNTDAAYENTTYGSQLDAGPSLLDLETTHHRFHVPQWQTAPVTQVRRAYAALDLVGPDAEDSRAAFYSWSDLDFPSTTPATLVADIGPLGLDTPNGYNTTTLGTPVELGTTNVGTDAIVSFGTNYVTADGSTLGTMELPVFIDANPGDNSWLVCWEDDRATWHDDIQGASGRNESGTLRAPVSGVTEYRTRDTGMPHDQITEVFPATFVTDATDDSPGAIALEAYRRQDNGIQDAA